MPAASPKGVAVGAGVEALEMAFPNVNVELDCVCVALPPPNMGAADWVVVCAPNIAGAAAAEAMLEPLSPFATPLNKDDDDTFNGKVEPSDVLTAVGIVFCPKENEAEVESVLVAVVLGAIG